MATENMSREEKEALLNIRMEEIRKRNAELQRRYEEVKADKQNAEMTSDTFQASRRMRPPAHEDAVRSSAPKHTAPRSRPRHTEKTGQVPRVIGCEPEMTRAKRLGEDDGPPPDPSYRFLADKSREGDFDAGESREKGSRRHAGNYGGQDFKNVRTSIQEKRNYDRNSRWHAPQTKMEMALSMTGRERREYDQWKSERSKIEQERMNRQKTATGEWKREWDREKVDQKQDPEPYVSHRQYYRADNRNRRRQGEFNGGRTFGRSQPFRASTSESSSGETDQQDTYSKSSWTTARTVQMADDSLNISISNAPETLEENSGRHIKTMAPTDSFCSHWDQTLQVFDEAPLQAKRGPERRKIEALTTPKPSEMVVAPDDLRKMASNQPVNRNSCSSEGQDNEESDEDGSWVTTSGNESQDYSECSQDNFVTTPQPAEITRNPEESLTYLEAKFDSLQVQDLAAPSEESNPELPVTECPAELESSSSRESTPVQARELGPETDSRNANEKSDRDREAENPESKFEVQNVPEYSSSDGSEGRIITPDAILQNCDDELGDRVDVFTVKNKNAEIGTQSSCSPQDTISDQLTEDPQMIPTEICFSVSGETITEKPSETALPVESVENPDENITAAVEETVFQTPLDTDISHEAPDSSAKVQQ